MDRVHDRNKALEEVIKALEILDTYQTAINKHSLVALLITAASVNIYAAKLLLEAELGGE